MDMESNHNNIVDEQFRRRLYDAETPPPAFVWQNVELELKKRKRRRGFLWLFIFGMAASGMWLMLLPAQRNARKQASETATLSANTPGAAPASTPSGENTRILSAAAPDAGIDATTSKAGASASTPAKKSGVKTAPAVKTIFQQALAPIAPLPQTPETTRLPDAAGVQRPVESASFPAKHHQLDMLPGADAALAFRRPLDLPKAKGFIRKRKDPKYCYDFAQNPNVWMVDAYAGPSFGRQSFRASNPDFDDYARMRRNTEEPGWAFNAGLRGSLLLGRHFIVRTGIHYEQMTTVFEHIDPNYVKYIVEITQTIVDNKPVVVIDTVGVEYGENYVKTYNRFGMIDVPLEIGGEMRRGRVGISLHAGLSFNALFWKRGTALSPGGQPQPFTPGEKDAVEIYRTRTGLSAGGSAQLFVHLHPTLRVFAEPYFRKVLKPLTLDDQQVAQRYGSWGIRFGAAKILD